VWAALGALVVLAGCAPGSGGGPPDMLREAAAAEQAWRQAYVILPGQQETERLDTAAPRLSRQAQTQGLLQGQMQGQAQRVPVVVFAHGCGGFDAESAETFRLLAAHGFAAIAPDHFARPDARPDARLGCASRAEAPTPTLRAGRGGAAIARPVLQSSGPDDGAYVGRRLDEISLAVWRVRELPWVDRGQVFLVGHSLGRGTAGLWPTRDVTAAAVLGQDCRAARGAAALEMPLSVAMLPLADRREVPGAEASAGQPCADWAMRPEATGGVVLGPMPAADVHRPEARRALLDFLQGRIRG
jgi:dienelactone hydrolase